MRLVWSDGGGGDVDKRLGLIVRSLYFPDCQFVRVRYLSKNTCFHSGLIKASDGDLSNGIILFELFEEELELEEQVEPRLDEEVVRAKEDI